MFPTRNFGGRLKVLWMPLAFSFLVLATRTTAQVSVTATAGTPGPTTYTTLKGAFDAVNVGTHTGAINISISANTTETASAVLNSSGAGSASYTSVLIKPVASANPVVSGSFVGTTTLLAALVRLNGADNVTIDGSNTTGGTTQNLTFTNTGVGSNAVIAITSANTADGATNNTVKNCLVSGAATGASAVTAGIYGGTITGFGIAAEAANSNNTIQNNIVTRAFNGVYVFGYGSASYDVAWNITNNTLGSTIAADYLISRGLLLYNASGFTVSGNTVTGVHSLATSITQSLGLQIGGALAGGDVYNNKVSNIRHNNNSGNVANTLGAFGLTLAATTTASNVSIHNNFFSDISSYGHASVLSQAGIYAATGGGFKLYHNSISLTTNPGLANAYTTAIVINTATGLDFRNNIFSNTQTTASPANRYAIYHFGTVAAFTFINNNDYYTSGTYLGYLAGVRPTLATWQTATGQDAASENILPVFASISDLHLPPASNATLDNQGTPVASVTTDIDGDVRSTTTPDIGADEFSLCPPIAFTQPMADTACIGGIGSFTAASTAATAFQWQLNTGTGWTNLTNNATYSGATTATLTITGATMAMTGYQYRAYATSACTNDTSAAAILTVSPVPATPTVTSNSPVCSGNTLTLTASAVATGGVVNWSGPASYSATGATATRTNTTTAMSGMYSATVTVLGCASVAANTAVTVNPTPLIGGATGTNPTACGVSNGSIALTGLAASTVYILTYTKDGITVGPMPLTSSLSGTLTIANLVNGVYTGFTVTTAGCPSPVNTATVNLVNPGTPALPSAIAGSSTGCIGGAAQTYSVTSVAGVTYNWTLPSGWSGSSTTASISATAGVAAQAGTIQVTASNSCGTSAAQTLAVSVGSTPAQPGPITGSQSNCAGVAQLYSVIPVTGATGYTWTLPPGWTGTSNTFSISVTPGAAGGNITVAATNTCGSSAVSTLAVSSSPSVAPTVSITPSTPTTICAGTPVTFTAVSTGGGASPQYHWLKNGVSTGNYTTTYSNSTLASGDVITLIMTSSTPCALPSPTVTSAPLTIIVQPITLTGVSINAAFSTAPTVCIGTPVTFVANTTGGGTTPAYQWRLNGAIVGTNAPTYTTATLAPGDSVMCVLASSATCPSPASAMSNKLGLDVVTSIAPQIAITASPDTAMALGQPVTFTAIVLVGDGPSPGYQWFKNGVGTGATGPSYTTTAWTTGDQFYVRMVSSLPCASPGVATSNTLRMTGTTSIAGAVAGAGLSLWPNPNTGRFTLALFNTRGNLRTRIEILNALGQVVYFREVFVDRQDWSTDIELGAGITAGIYLLRITGEDGSRSTERFELRR